MFAKLISTEENLSGLDIDQLYLYCIENVKSNLGQHALKTDICLEALAYLSLKERFKKHFLIKHMAEVCRNVDSLYYQAFVFMVLNMCRDSTFDTIPSYSIQRSIEESDKSIDLSYW